MKSFEENLKELQDLIDKSNKIVFFGGAGVSTESGIPDFRSKDGLYNQHDVRFDAFSAEYLLSHSCLYDNPEVFFEYYRQKLNCSGIKPNITHYKLAELEKAGKLLAVITQNIDGLHQAAGSKNVLEIHGTTRRVYCNRCKKEFNPDIIFESTEPVPKCDCGGMLRPDVTLYEESLPQKAWEEAVFALQSADLFIIGGTSLMVYPANTLMRYFNGGKTVIINIDKTHEDENADLVIHEGLGRVFEKIKV
ncbi:MAG: NAD-dependent protein deacylase [Clostridia bacterium]|nr:NAD-dependent protein deacylase [Clostridia bacterium]